MAHPWIGVQKLAVVPTFNRQFDHLPPPNDWENLVMRRVLYDPDPTTGIDRSLQGYLSAISYGQALLDAKLFSSAFSNGPGVVEAAWQSLPANHGYPFVLCVIPFYDGDANRRGWFTTVGQNGVTAVSRVAMFDNLVQKVPEIPGVWAMEVLHAIVGLPDLYKVNPAMGDFDNMTYNAGTHSCAFLKLAAGWLAPGDVAQAKAGQTIHHLQPIGLSRPPAGTVAAVRVPARTSGNTFYIEARLKSDVYERGFSPLATGGRAFRGLPGEGVIVYETVSPNDLEKTFLRTPIALQTGQTYANSAEGFSVSVAGTVGEGLSVHVNRVPDARCPALLQQIEDIKELLAEETELQILKQLRSQLKTLRDRAQALGCI